MIIKIIKNIFIFTLKTTIKQGLLPIKIDIKDYSFFTITKSKNSIYGDFSCNIAMVLRKYSFKKPLDLARILVKNIIDKKKYINEIEIVEPGFINIIVSSFLLKTVIPNVLLLQDQYGYKSKKLNQKVLIEFISANPTGPLHVGHARGAFLGDSLARILKAVGFDVVKEFYINDVGNQVEILGTSIYDCYRKLCGESIKIEKGKYFGDYIIDIAKILYKKDGHKWIALKKHEWLPYFIKIGIKHNLSMIKQHLKTANIYIDSWFSEQSLHEENKLSELIKDYYKKNMLYRGNVSKKNDNKVRRKESNAAKYAHNQLGGIFLKTSKFGDKEDRVIIKNDGKYVYLTSDLAYHRNKLSRNFNRLISIFGADHSDHITRIKAGMKALNLDDSKLEFIIIQLVNLIKTNKVVKISKRNNDIYSLHNLINKIGSNAVRYLFLMRSSNSKIAFNIDLLLKNNYTNQIFYLQYGYARMANIIKKAFSYGISLRTEDLIDNILNRLTLKIERNMIIKIAIFESCVESAANKLEPHIILYYCKKLVSDFNSYFTQYKYEEKIISKNIGLTKARLALVIALKQTLKNALNLLGINAPNYMKSKTDIN